MCKISLGLSRDATLAQRVSNHGPHGPSEAGRVWICVSSPLSLPSVLSIFSAVLSYEGKNAKQKSLKKVVWMLWFTAVVTEICIHSPSSRLHLWHYYWTGCFNHSDGKSGRARSVVRMDTAMEHHATRLVKFIFYIQFMFSACFIFRVWENLSISAPRYDLDVLKLHFKWTTLCYISWSLNCIVWLSCNDMRQFLLIMLLPENLLRLGRTLCSSFHSMEKNMV